MVILTVEVIEPGALTLAEVQRAIAEREPATLEMPGWGPAPEVLIVKVMER